jgi:hypothetical protein
MRQGSYGKDTELTFRMKIAVMETHVPNAFALPDATRRTP